MTESAETPLGATDLALLDEIILGSARGGAKRLSPVEIEVVRALGEDDLPALLAPPPVGANVQRLRNLTHGHHLLARCLAEGHEQEHVSLITGFSTSYISTIKSDPMFGQLLVYYQTQREQIFVDVVERMRVLGLSTLDELQARLAEAPEKWSARELMEMAELMLVKGREQGAKPGAGGGPGVSISVKFIRAEGDTRPLVDITPDEGKARG